MLPSRNHYDVIVVGAGVVGPAVATTLARQGRRVLIVERDWSEPDRIVGELMQPSGLRALKAMGMLLAINNANAIHVDGYYVAYHDTQVDIKYPFKADVAATEPVPHCVADTLHTDATLDAVDWESCERERGVGFHHGLFILNLRAIAKREPNVTALQGTVTKLEGSEVVTGIRVNIEDAKNVLYTADLTVACDGIYSRFRKLISANNMPVTGSHFVGMTLKNAVLPAPNHGHVILGDHAPILLYQISPEDTRILCAYRSAKPPAASDLHNYLQDQVLPHLPVLVKPSFKAALAAERPRVMPNQYLSARPNKVPGLLLIGDALNMRHPLTGGGMTVGLNDAALVARILAPERCPSLANHAQVLKCLTEFHSRRKSLDSVVNVLSIALYTLFAADNANLTILQKGCFGYFLRGGECVSGPAGLLSGLLPSPFALFYHFFSVAFYALYLNFGDKWRHQGILGLLLAVLQVFTVLYTAVVVFAPYLWNELLGRFTSVVIPQQISITQQSAHAFSPIAKVVPSYIPLATNVVIPKVNACGSVISLVPAPTENAFYLDSVKRKRKLKMKKHKLRKRRRAQRALKKKLE
ncbi:hypothetical protein BABINDRAFT_14890 [Babjeviella inositovora NRRL Y-12698]|uniref:Squalene monooxygenase n=1 Tax=Babjeviella inositovora NRRL Y-12698 TaxID=984486 RepID=A0A1E3QMS7_9ASCO|nr:uncharacterized protein BABINDRAFT_14890 [Babjeviella inositovora NRRL Y-12698]ODQ78307.1 hypothetical protein BABINDRAFT_14890 [Babjeviella inositovora NRRL Y-12698]